MIFFVCLEDGAASALYRMRKRRNSWWGKCGPASFPIRIAATEYRRVTCGHGRQYDVPKSEWFARTYSNEQDCYLDSYAQLGFVQGWLVWWAHQINRLNLLFKRV